MKLGSLVRGVAAALTCLTSTVASAQTVIARWDFNTSLTAPSTGSGTLTTLGGVTSATVSGFGSSDGGSAHNITTWPAQGTGSGTAGMQFAVSTVNRQNIIVSTDLRWSGSCSKYVKAQYSTNGTTFIDMPAGSNPNGALITSPGNTNFVNGNTWDLTGVMGVDFNPNFAVRFVTIFDPANNTTYSTNTGVAYGATGTLRFDAFAVSGTATTPVDPSGTGSANPTNACRGLAVKLSVSTLPGQNPPSNAVLVSADLSGLGGSNPQAFTETAAGLFEHTIIVPIGTPLGALVIPFTVTETNEMPRSTNGDINLTINDCITDAAVVISQVYGGGGNFPDSIYRQDFVELYNRSANPVDIGGWSVQYAPATGSFNQKVDIPALTTLQPGQYYLVQLSGSTGGSQDLPTPDLTGGISMAQNSGKVALVTNNVLLGTPCIGPTVSDVVAFGTSAGSVSCFEGLTGPALGMSNTNAVIRINNGCTDTNSNIDDFGTGIPTPRNSAFPVNSCAGDTLFGSGFYSAGVHCLGDSYQITVTASGGAGPYAATADLSAVGGSASQVLNDFGGGSFGFMGTVDMASTIRRFFSAVTITDAAGHSVPVSVQSEVGRCQPSASQVSDPKALCVNRAGQYRLVVFPILANANPPSAGVMSVEADFSAIGGSASVLLADDGTGVWAGGEMVTGAFGTGTFNIPYVLTDLEARVYNGMATVEVIECADAAKGIKISQVYGAGGNSNTPPTPASSFDQDFIELFNSSGSSIDVTGWAVQYTSETGPNTTPEWFVVPLSGSIPSGGYYLVAVNGGGTLGAPALPAPDAMSTAFGMSSSGGKLAVTTDTIALLTSLDCASGSVVDQVSWGSMATCFEGHGSAGGHNNNRSLLRNDNGCMDTNNNDADLATTGTVNPRNSSSTPSPCPSTCSLDYNQDTVINPDDLGDFITDYFSEPHVPGPGGYAIPCPGNAPPYDAGYKAAFVPGGAGQCNEPFSDNLGDWITQYFGDQTCG